MRVRLRLDPRQHWVVESKCWYGFNWNYEESFYGDKAYDSALLFAQLLKHAQIEEIT